MSRLRPSLPRQPDKLLAEREGLFFVDLDCSRCGSHTVAIVTVESDDTELSIIDASDIELAVDLEPEHLGEELPEKRRAGDRG